MDQLDTFAGPTTPSSSSGILHSPNSRSLTRTDNAQPQTTSLDAEIDQVKQNLGSFGTSLSSFWGSVRKQSASAYSAASKELETRTEAARKDLAPYLDKAKEEYAKTREEVTKLGEQLKTQASATSPLSSPLLGDGNAESQQNTRAGVPTTSFYGEVMMPPPSTLSSSTETTPLTLPTIAVPASATAFLNRIQSQVQPMQERLASTLQNVNANVHVPNLNSLNLENTSKLAESYVQKATPLFQQASKDVGKFFENAVKVVPPDAFAAEQFSTSQVSESAQAKTSTKTERAAAAALGRKEALLQKLQSNQAILLIDPAVDLSASHDNLSEEARALADSKEAYAAFLTTVQAAGGLDSPEFAAKKASALKDSDGTDSSLKSTMEALVPARLTNAEFWARYFFRAQQIEEEDARRQQVLQSAEGQSEDDFNWDAEEEEPPSVARAEVEHCAAPQPSVPAKETPAVSVSADTSPVSPTTRLGEQQVSARNSSEEGTSSSYDMVSVSAASRSAAPSSGVNSDIEKKNGEAAKDGDASDDDWE